MTGYLLDTDWITDLLHDQPVAVDALPVLTATGAAMSLIAYGELYEGASYSRDPEASLTGLKELLAIIPVLPLDIEIVERFSVLRGSLPRNHRQQIGDFDLLIAATALVHDLILVTRNIRDFKLVPGLTLYESSSDS